MNFTDFDIARRFDELDHKAVLAECAHFSIKNVRMAAERVVDAGHDLFPPMKQDWRLAPTWMHEMGGYLDHGNRVAAIKTIRNSMQCGLKEALDVVDNLIGREGAGALTDFSRPIYDLIVNAGFVYTPAPPRTEMPAPQTGFYVVVGVWPNSGVPEVLAVAASRVEAEQVIANAGFDYSMLRINFVDIPR